eukprot:10763070-Alexandrium_andersonii.AAC.1
MSMLCAKLRRRTTVSALLFSTGRVREEGGPELPGPGQHAPPEHSSALPLAALLATPAASGGSEKVVGRPVTRGSGVGPSPLAAAPLLGQRPPPLRPPRPRVVRQRRKKVGHNLLEVLRVDGGLGAADQEAARGA